MQMQQRFTLFALGVLIAVVGPIAPRRMTKALAANFASLLKELGA